MMRPDHCSQCGKPIDGDNPISAGGGRVSWDGQFTNWVYGACCRKPLVTGEFQKILEAVFKAP